jgi:succinate dehydrogenase/fumarate reductase cytochrome b subunit (b558 family)
MSTRALTKRQVVTNSVPSHQGLADWVQPRLRSSVGGKYVVAVTGLILTSFVVVHMLGNLQVFLGSDAINAYAAFLKGHPVLLWTARVVLFITFLVHIGVALWLNWKARRARPIGYARKRTVQASFASRHMVITGLFVLVFTGFHIAHFTLGVVTEAEVKPAVTAPPGEAPAVYENYLDLRDPSDPKRHDVYAMMIYGFRNPIIAVGDLLPSLPSAGERGARVLGAALVAQQSNWAVENCSVSLRLTPSRGFLAVLVVAHVQTPTILFAHRLDPPPLSPDAPGDDEQKHWPGQAGWSGTGIGRSRPRGRLSGGFSRVRQTLPIAPACANT